ncbi:MAG: class I SAM-dependent methyltransferase [Pirellulales bacterium]
MISGIILAHNEEHSIVDCIRALRPHVGEVLLIDTESTDRTVELAKRLVDRVLSHPNVPNFDAVRNIAIPEARFDWLWFVDADERIPERTGQLVNELIRNRGHEFEAINIPFKSYFCGQWIQHCGWWPGYTGCRVLKRGHFEYGHDLHSGVKLHGREWRFPPDPELAVPHYSYRDVAHYLSKCNNYTTTEAVQLKAHNTKYDWRAAVHAMVRDLWAYYELHRGDLDGSLGWILSWLAGQYRWMTHAKLIDLERRSDVVSAPADLDEFMAAMEYYLAVCRATAPTCPLGIVLRVADPRQALRLPEIVGLAAAIAKTDREVAVDTGDLIAMLETRHGDRGLLKSLCRARRPKHSVGIVYDPPHTAAPDASDVVRVLRTHWPSAIEQICDEWLERAQLFDEVWIDTESQKSILRRKGLAPERLRVIPPVVDGDCEVVETAIATFERRLRPLPLPPPRTSQLRVDWEGELFAGHSFSNINESLLLELCRVDSIAVRLRRVFHNPADDRLAPRSDELLPLVGRDLAGEPDVTIRHAYPPNWVRPETGLWVHIQPWEFGHLPNEWIQPLCDEVDEIWAPSNYVKRVYVDSGIPPEKIQVIPWGIDPAVFNPAAPPLALCTQKSFCFIFVGGTIHRKGIDRVLDAYLAEFMPTDDVCLVIKDVGTRSFYLRSNWRQQIQRLVEDDKCPEIIYMDADFTAGQLASLYTACHCLVAPYRGEGFGLPVLEAMACGLAPIVPKGGPTDDFVQHGLGYVVPSEEVRNGMPGLCKPGTEFLVSIDDLRRLMRHAATKRAATHQVGLNAARAARERFTWSNTARQVVERIHALVRQQRPIRGASCGSTKGLAALVIPTTDDQAMGECLCRLHPFVGTLAVLDVGISTRTRAIAGEYGAEVVSSGSITRTTGGSDEWLILLKANEFIEEQHFAELDRLMSCVPDQIRGIRVRVQMPSEPEKQETRIFRGSLESLPMPLGVDSFDTLRQQVTADTILSEIVVTCLERIHDREGRPPVAALDPGLLFEAGERQNFPRNKGVLIQLATGQHRELLENTRAHHRSYAQRHGLDYCYAESNPAAPKRAGWGKISLILSAMRAGYERIVWLDADAVILDTNVNLAELTDQGIGMVKHPNPLHWNSGVVIVVRSSATEKFFEAVHREPENTSAWMEQLAINSLAERTEFAGLLVELAAAYNTTPGAVTSHSPVVIAAHGLPHCERRRLIAEWVEEAARIMHSSDAKAIAQIATREHFGSFLNGRGLLGQAAEIGVLRGAFSRMFLDRWRGAVLHLIDPWRHLDDYRDISNLSDTEHESCLAEVHRNLVAHTGRYMIHRQLSQEAVHAFGNESLDFVYLDANHALEATLRDIRSWMQKVRPGGVLAGHDYLDGDLPEADFGVKSAVRSFEREADLVAHCTREAWPSWYFIKQA